MISTLTAGNTCFMQMLILGALITSLIFGAYLAGCFHGARHPGRWQDIFSRASTPLTRTGFLWALALPMAWIAIYYAFIAHIWLSLGRWPRFGESLAGRILPWHQSVVMLGLTALVGGACFTPLVLIASAVWRRWRHLSIYALAYGAAVAIAWGSIFLAPSPFLNWLLD